MKTGEIPQQKEFAELFIELGTKLVTPLLFNRHDICAKSQLSELVEKKTFSNFSNNEINSMFVENVQQCGKITFASTSDPR